MNDTTDTPVVVSPNAGLIDALTAAGRYLVVIFTVFPALLALFKSGDLLGILAFFQANDGASLAAAVIGLGTLAYGIIKTRKRGAQIATVAGDPRVPVTVATTK